MNLRAEWLTQSKGLSVVAGLTASTILFLQLKDKEVKIQLQIVVIFIFIVIFLSERHTKLYKVYIIRQVL